VAEAAKEAGGTVNLTMDMPQVGRFHAIQDPQGAVVCVIKYYPPPESQD
jgi:predicted enzyme related to lactoylglutathione lyase